MRLDYSRASKQNVNVAVNVPNWDAKLINYQEHADFFK
jgi:hypothetical protein